MKSLLFLIISLGFFSFSKAQQPDSYPFFNQMKGKRIVVADTAILHVGPSAGAAFTDTLFFGEPIQVLMAVPYFEQVKSIDVPWLKITYFKKGFTRVSYILAHEVSLTPIIEEEAFIWLTALQQSASTEKYILVLKLKDKKIESKITIAVPTQFVVDSIELEVAVKPCLQNTSQMLSLNLKSITAEMGMYNKWVVQCIDSQITSLPFTHTYFSTKLKAQIQEKIIFQNQTSFKLSSTILSKKVKETVVKYKWQDCNYINL